MNVVAILNHGRPQEYITDIIDKCLKQSIDIDTFIISTDSNFTVSAECDSLVIDNKDTTVAEAKNVILDKASKLGDNVKLFLIEDDVDIFRIDAFEKYLTLMNDLNLGLLFSCYTNTSNYVLTIPSPRVELVYEGRAPSTSVITNRHEASDFIVIDLDKNDTKFDETLTCFEFSEYVFRCHKDGIIPALNQFFDISDSWKYLGKRRNCKSLRKYTDDVIDADKKRMDKLIDNQWTIENDIKVVVDYIRKQIGV